MISQTSLNDYEREAQLRKRSGEVTLTVSVEDLLSMLEELRQSRQHAERREQIRLAHLNAEADT